MNTENDHDTNSVKNTGFWARLWRQPKRLILLGIPIGAWLALVLGIALTGGFIKAVDSSNTLAFCTSCHEMEAYVFQEYKQSQHFSNSSGVQAICADCHVPKAFFPKMKRKIAATFNELPAHLAGRIDTPEEFEAHRAELAQNVWDTMKANNSRECHDCHSYEAMNAELQDRTAQRRHSAEYREATGKTCIDCHKGIAHKLPDKL